MAGPNGPESRGMAGVPWEGLEASGLGQWSETAGFPRFVAGPDVVLSTPVKTEEVIAAIRGEAARVKQDKTE